MDSESKEQVDVKGLQHELEVLREEYLYTLRKMLERAHLHDSSILELKVNKSECLALKKEIEKKTNELYKLQFQLDSKVTELEGLKKNYTNLVSSNTDLVSENLVKDRKIEAFELQCSSLTSAYIEKSKEVEDKEFKTTKLETKLNVMEENYAVIESENSKLREHQMVVKERFSAVKIDSEKCLVELNEKRNQLRLTTIQFHALQKALNNKKRQKRNLEKDLQQAKSENDLVVDKLSKKQNDITMLMGQIASMSSEIALLKPSLSEAQSKIVWLREKNKKHVDELQENLQLENKIRVLQSELEKVNNKNSKLTSQYEKVVISSSHKINSLLRENSVQSKQLQAQRTRSNELENNALKQRKVHKPSLLKKLSVLLNPRKRKLLEQIEFISQSEYFDAEWYLRNNLDVAYSSLDPIEHFLLFGADEGRDPSLKFSCKSYCDENPDVAQSNINPLLHYLKYGIKEGRKFSVKNVNFD